MPIFPYGDAGSGYSAFHPTVRLWVYGVSPVTSTTKWNSPMWGWIYDSTRTSNQYYGNWHPTYVVPNGAPTSVGFTYYPDQYMGSYSLGSLDVQLTFAELDSHNWEINWWYNLNGLPITNGSNYGLQTGSSSSDLRTMSLYSFDANQYPNAYAGAYIQLVSKKNARVGFADPSGPATLRTDRIIIPY